jgi:hypothetical protein
MTTAEDSDDHNQLIGQGSGPNIDLYEEVKNIIPTTKFVHDSSE